MELKELLKTRATLAQELARKRSSIIEAERALRLCEQLATDIPRHIQNLLSTEITPVLSEQRAPDDRLVNCAELNRNQQAVAALERLFADLKDVRGHWQSRLKLLTA